MSAGGLAGGTEGRDGEILDEAFARTAAVMMGRRMFDIGEDQWGDDPPFHVPVLVLTHEPRDALVMEGGTTFTFVTGGVDNALEQARASAGEGGIWIAGGANVIQQFLRAGLLDELQIHLIPVLLGDGTRLFDHHAIEAVQLERTRVREADVTHLLFRIVKRRDEMDFNSILIGSENPEGLAAFYAKVFGEPAWEDGGYHGWQIGSGLVTVGPHDQVTGRNSQPGRLIWNIETPDVKGEFERMKAAGAAVVAEPYRPAEESEAWIATLADPDDNYFQLVSPMR